MHLTVPYYVMGYFLSMLFQTIFEGHHQKLQHIFLSPLLKHNTEYCYFFRMILFSLSMDLLSKVYNALYQQRQTKFSWPSPSLWLSIAHLFSFWLASQFDNPTKRLHDCHQDKPRRHTFHFQWLQTHLFLPLWILWFFQAVILLMISKRKRSAYLPFNWYKQPLDCFCVDKN